MSLWRPFVIAVGMLAAAATWASAEPYVSGFVEITQGVRIQQNAALDESHRLADRSYPRSEMRAQLKLSGGGDRDEYFLRTDFVSDQAYAAGSRVDVREAYLKLYPYRWLDVKVGRQVATWGTGDLLFANDLFAKDWVAFFTGMELSYLKPPQDLLRIAIYRGGTTIEWAASPYHTMDRLPTGERLSIYNPFSGTTTGQEGAPPVQKRPRTMANAEWFLRVSGMKSGYEWALYGYRGFYPQPLGVVMEDSVPVLYAPRLTSGGASIRGTLGPYLVNLEGAYYHSEEEDGGTNPTLPNSAVKLLAGAEKSLGSDLTASVQWFGDVTMDYDAVEAEYEAAGRVPPGLWRHTLTLRLTKFLRYQTVNVSFFGYWGVSDEDVYLRPSVEYDFSDALKFTLGVNWLDGQRPYTLFGQFRDNSNVYGRARYSF